MVGQREAKLFPHVGKTSEKHQGEVFALWVLLGIWKRPGVCQLIPLWFLCVTVHNHVTYLKLRASYHPEAPVTFGEDLGSVLSTHIMVQSRL